MQYRKTVTRKNRNRGKKHEINKNQKKEHYSLKIPNNEILNYFHVNFK